MSSRTLFNLSAPLDRLCVVVPAFNEELLVGRCLTSVLQAGVPAANIFVIDDQSTDRTADIVAGFNGVQLLSNTQRLGKLGGLRRAIADFDLVRRYDYLSLLDADSHVTEDYFVSVVGRFAERSDTVLVCGAPSSDRCNWLTAYRALDYAITLRTYRKGQDALGVITVAPGCASTYRTSVLESFDWGGGTLVEDMDLTIQVHRKQLGTIVYAGDAVVCTQDPRRLSEYIGQMTRWYSGTWQVMRLHRIPFGRQRVDAEFAVLIVEGVCYSALTALLPLLAVISPTVLLRWLIIDQMIYAVMAGACAVHARRVDVIAWFPTFLIPRYLNAIILLRTFWLEILRGRRRQQWFHVTRYDKRSTTMPAERLNG